LNVDAAKPQKPVIGLTGGIASGKSVVGRELAERGVVVIDADRLAREVVEPGTTALAEIVRVFGAEVLKEDGSLDREKVAARVFHDPEARKTLNGIVHPRIGQRSAELIAAAMQSSAPYIVYEAPLLVETGAHRAMAALIVVAAAPEVQLARVQARDGMSEEAARARLAAQLPLETKLAAADYVIHNDRDRAELSRQIAEVHAQICRRFNVKLPT
jgi:dephospho-CoA kinase